jgi:hypothetical protein
MSFSLKSNKVNCIVGLVGDILMSHTIQRIKNAVTTNVDRYMKLIYRARVA